MRRAVALTGLVVALAVVALWLGGGLAGIERWATDQQRAVQNAMAGALRALRSGQPGAVASLLGLCFAYGVAHAVGPGHGKVIIGSYGFGAQVPLARLAGLSVRIVAGAGGHGHSPGLGRHHHPGLGAPDLTDLSEVAMVQASTVLVASVGLWLAWRGLSMLRAQARADHHHHHHHGDACGCGHAHGPTPQQVAQTRSLRDGVLVVAGIALRPCTGALFLLILTWRMGIFGMGILGRWRWPGHRGGDGRGRLPSGLGATRQLCPAARTRPLGGRHALVARNAAIGRRGADRRDLGRGAAAVALTRVLRG
ncbi:hypothetical protein F1642_02920 [Paracoccus sp. NBH48]|uniref:nickel/cobalt transporter n=1 Tax=Paracoccus sp. NBH48 TaxID=2596918 RepID=UPI00189117BB|nr:hypothetical protein [Paracoccus sp. NBH48]MBF5078188.1 hypothetical protein [Paracoccus sp. NBH48]